MTTATASAARALPILFLAAACGAPTTNAPPLAPGEDAPSDMASASDAWSLPSPALLVVNKGHHGSTRPSELVIVDPKTGHIVARIPTGIESHEVAVSPDGRLAVVTNTGPYSKPGHSLSVIELATQKELRRVELGSLPNPHGIVWNEHAFTFTAEGAKAIARYDPAKDAVDWTMGIGQDSIHMLVYSKDGSKIYTADRGSASVAVVKPGERGQTIIPIAEGPEGIDITPDGAEVWVGSHGAISVIDTATERVVATMGTGTDAVNRVKITPDGKRALATQRSGPVIVYDVAERTELARVDTGGGGSSLLITPDGKLAYVGMTDKDRVAVVDLNTLTVTGTLQPGEGPDGMAWIAPDRQPSSEVVSGSSVAAQR